TNQANVVCWLPDGQSLVSCGADRMLRWWDAHSRRQTLQVHREQPITALAVSPTGMQLAAGYSRHGLEIFTSHTGELLRRIETDAPLDTVCFSPDEQLLAWADTQGISLYDLSQGRELQRFPGPGFWTTGWKRGLAFSKNGALLAYGTGSGEVVLW